MFGAGDEAAVAGPASADTAELPVRAAEAFEGERSLDTVGGADASSSAAATSDVPAPRAVSISGIAVAVEVFAVLWAAVPWVAAV